MSDAAGPRKAGASRLSTSPAIAALEERASVKRKIVRKLSKLAATLVASGAIEPPAHSSLEAQPPPRKRRR